jgi:hypothetical protein
MKEKMAETISVGQLMAELLCRDDFKCEEYETFTENWNPIPEAIRADVLLGVREYLERQLGKEKVTD